MTQKTATSAVIALMNQVICTMGAEREIPEIENRNGVPITVEAIQVRITNNKARFPEWDFYTRTCQQTQKKIIGARPVRAAQ